MTYFQIYCFERMRCIDPSELERPSSCDNGPKYVRSCSPSQVSINLETHTLWVKMKAMVARGTKEIGLM